MCVSYSEKQSVERTPGGLFVFGESYLVVKKGQVIWSTRAPVDSVFVSRQASLWKAMSVDDVNPLPSLMCLTSNSMLSHTHTLTHTHTHTHRNWEWSTTAGNRHRTEQSCHTYTAELTHIRSCTDIRTQHSHCCTNKRCIHTLTHTHTHTRAGT